MSQSTLQNNQNNPTELQSTVIQPGQSSNINYSDVNVNSSENSFPTFYANTNNSDLLPTSNEYTASTSTPIVSSFDIPGFKIIVIPTFSQQENTYMNYSSSNITNTQFQ
ncbi:hypothetical protein RhiirA4_484045 [Rhizophagus irregularis]|uniref:Uncharacterized protein n=1 Tax=Rhizophagus irregularis TaxID=588596 RepID=A0A2I1HNE3_9GLOM|nr:hypothetical protein RhiirA4_484045 [Rhizophagus irregularis]